MSQNTDELYNLLPSIYRMRDSDRKEVLKEYLSVLEKQGGLVEDDIARLYDNWFIETCDEWLVPYIGNLLGVRGLHPISEKANFSQRSRVANTLSYRRRKGTASMLEQLAYDSTGWQARAVEFFQLLIATQNYNHIRLDNHRTPDIRDYEKMELIDTPFDSVAHLADIRHIESRRGYHNIPHVGLFLWRLEAYPVYRAPAFSHNNGRYSFSQLGNDIRLFNNPVTEEEASHLAGETNVPSQIRRLAFYDNKNSYYGKGQSIFIWVDNAEIPPERYAFDWNKDNELVSFLRDDLGILWVDSTATVNRWDEKINVINGTDRIDIQIYGNKARLITDTGKMYEFEIKDENNTKILYLDVIVPCDLSGWEHIPQKGQVAVDPVLGRIAFSDNDKRDVKVSYFYGFSSEVGGGFYDRDLGVPGPEVTIYEISQKEPPLASDKKFNSISSAILQWAADPDPKALFLIKDSEIYIESLDFEIPAGRTLEIRAENENRPVINLKKTLKIKGKSPLSSEEGAQITLDGLVITGSGLKIMPGDLGELNIHQCTLVPGISLGADGKPMAPNKFSLAVEKDNDNLTITIDRSITGKLNLESANQLHIKDSIIDGIAGTAINAPQVTAQIEESTIIGDVSVMGIALASNSIFTDKVKAVRKQQGCMRYCYVRKGQATPRQFHCQPATYIQKVQDDLLTKAKLQKGLEKETFKKTIENFVNSWFKPCFADRRYGHPEYAQLYLLSPEDILKGADDESEMGVFHHIMQPQREANLRSSLDEYLRFGLEAGILYANYEQIQEVLI
jgi:hypothetical protein